IVLRARAGSRPRPEVELACGSRSTSTIECPSSASAAPRLMAVVVLPTPPFWLTMARTVALVVDNILGLARTADPTSGVMRGIVSFPSTADQPPCQEAERVDRGRIVAAVERPARPFGALPVPVRPLPRLAPYRPR